MRFAHERVGLEAIVLERVDQLARFCVFGLYSSMGVLSAHWYAEYSVEASKKCQVWQIVKLRNVPAPRSTLAHGRTTLKNAVRSSMSESSRARISGVPIENDFDHGFVAERQLSLAGLTLGGKVAGRAVVVHVVHGGDALGLGQRVVDGDDAVLRRRRWWAAGRRRCARSTLFFSTTLHRVQCCVPGWSKSRNAHGLGHSVRVVLKRLSSC